MSSSSRWTREEDDVMICAFSRGLNPGRIAKKLKTRTRDAVKARIRYLGLTTGDVCNCAECKRGDALPVRLHGIPHAKQLRFAVVPPAPLTIAASNEVEEIKPSDGAQPDPDQIAIGF